MIRQVIQIDEEKCNGCGLCVNACHESALGLVDGKAKLLRDDYCDGMGDCLPECPTGAISFVEREAAAYDEEAVKENQRKKDMQQEISPIPEGGCQGSQVRILNVQSAPEGGCPGSQVRILNPQLAAEGDFPESRIKVMNPQSVPAGGCQGAQSRTLSPEKEGNPFVPGGAVSSQLTNWPVQIKLAPLSAPYFNEAELLIAADCTAYAYAAFHQQFMSGRVTLIGCPKLDDIDYSVKLTSILSENSIKSVTLARMEVPCCGGLEMAVRRALQNSGKEVPLQVVTIGINGQILGV